MRRPCRLSRDSAPTLVCPALLLSARRGLLRGAAHAEAKVAVGAHRVEVAPVRNRTDPRRSAPAAATRDTEGTGGTACRVGYSAAAVVPIPVIAPFPYIPVHVVQPQRIRLLLFHLVRLSIAVGIIPRIVSQLGFFHCAAPSAARRCAPARAAYSHSVSVGSR